MEPIGEGSLCGVGRQPARGVNVLHRVRAWAKSFFRRARFERDLADEMELHLSLRTDDLVRTGLSPAEASRRARLDFGNVPAHKEDVRTIRGLAFFDIFASDLRYVIRGLGRNWLLSISIVATLALTIGISTGVFTLINSVALRARVDHDRDSFFRVHVVHETGNARGSQFGPASFADFEAFRSAATSARSLTAYVRVEAPLDARDLQNTRILAVMCNFFSTYTPPRPLIGRALQQSDCDHTEMAIVLAESVWRERYAADTTIVGRTIRVNERLLTVVGVLPNYDGQLENAVGWVPLTITPMLGLEMDFAHRSDDVGLTVDGFAAQGHSRSNVAAELSLSVAQQDRLHPGRRSRVMVTDGSSIDEPGSRARISTVVAIVMLVLGFVVFIACTNVTMLLLSRAEARRQEVGIRLALGASRARLLRLLLTETLFLAMVAGIISIWFVYSMPPLLVRVIGAPSMSWSFDPDWRVFGWLAAITLLAGVLAGLTPSLQALDVSLIESLKSGSSGAGGGRRRMRVYNRLITSQLALSFVLIAGCFLLYHSYQRIAGVDVGYATRDLMRVSLSDRDRSNPRVGLSLRSSIRPRLLEVPGVVRVAFSTALPSSQRASTSAVGVSFGSVRASGLPVSVSAGFFETLGIRILEGHDLQDAEPACTSGGCSVLLSQQLARQLFAGGKAVGAALRTDSGVVLHVIGVVSDVTTATGVDGALPVLYEPWAPEHGRYVGFARFAGRQSEIAGLIGTAVRQAVPDISVDVRVEQELIDEDARFIRQLAALVGVLGLIAAALAMIGAHGVISFSSRRRAKEFGVRIALGATSRDIYRVVARGHARPILTGMLAGVFISIPAAIFVQRSLGGAGRFPILNRESPVSFAIAAFAMFVAIVIATAAPARRAGATDPLQAMRVD